MSSGEPLTVSLSRAPSDPVTASQQSYARLFHMVQREAGMLSFIDIYWLLGFLFLSLIPLVFLMKRPVPKRNGAGLL